MPSADFQIKEICCVGGGYVGGSSSAILALKTPGVNVTVVDRDASRVESWKSNVLPFSEPGLLDAVLTARDSRTPTKPERRTSLGSFPTTSEYRESNCVQPPRRPNLFFSTDVDNVIRKADIIFVAVETPWESKKSRGGSGSNLTSFNAVIRKIGEVARKDFILINKSTVPCGTADATRNMLSELLHPKIQFEVLSNPEFLAEGTAVQDLLYPDRLVIGSLLNSSGLAAAKILVDLYATWVPREKIITMSTNSSELSKLAANALLAQRISSINALSAICDEAGADVTEVSHACGLDHRIGPHMLKASLGFGGSCFKKDLLHLSHTASHLQLHDVASYWNMVLSMNEQQTNRFINRITSQVPNTMRTKVVGILGFAFKAGTDDTRESPAISVVCSLLQQRYLVRIFDPLVPHSKILEGVKAGLADRGGLNPQQVTVCSSVYEACEGAHAVAILTGWESLRFITSAKSSHEINGRHIKTTHSDLIRSTNGSVNGLIEGHAEDGHNTAIDWERVVDLMRKPKYICDGHNILDRRVASLGFTIDGVGRCSQTDSRNQAASHTGRFPSIDRNGIDLVPRAEHKPSLGKWVSGFKCKWFRHFAVSFIKPQWRKEDG